MHNQCKAGNTIVGLVDHAVERATERGFTSSIINEIITNGEIIHSVSKYGTKQVTYKYGRNSVIQALEGRNAGKIVTVFSDDIENGGKFVPFK